MKVTLTRQDVLNIYNAFKTLNLKGADIDLSRNIVVNQMKLRSAAHEIEAENREIDERFQTDEFKKAVKEFYDAKEKHDIDKTPENAAIVQEKWKILQPIDKEVCKNQSAAKQALEKEYKIELIPIGTDVLIEHLSSLNQDYSYSNIEPLTKLLN